jgi:hypothetical protein
MYFFTTSPHEVFNAKGYFLVQYKMSESHFASKTLPVGGQKRYSLKIVIEKQMFANYY